jgi:rRNA maturation endonuclease Nob1
MKIYFYQKNGGYKMRYLTNDNTFECTYCEEIFKVYSTSGETNFCPCCGTRASNLEECEEETSI